MDYEMNRRKKQPTAKPASADTKLEPVNADVLEFRKYYVWATYTTSWGLYWNFLEGVLIDVAVPLSEEDNITYYMREATAKHIGLKGLGKKNQLWFTCEPKRIFPDGKVSI